MPTNGRCSSGWSPWVRAGPAEGAARRLTHARILLLADTASGQERADTDIVNALGTGVRTVERVRQRLVTEGLQAALDPGAQPPRPAEVKIKGDVEQQLIRLACRDPPEGRCRWTLQLPADELVVLGRAGRSAPRRCARALKKTRLANLAETGNVERG